MAGGDGAADWFQPFFRHESYVGFHRAHVARAATGAEVDFIEQAMGLEGRLDLLDVPCGEGRVAAELAKRGHRVTGVDLSEPLIGLARERSESRRLGVRWERRDMRRLDRQQEFDGAVCWWGSWGYFDDEGNREFARAVFDALRPGGRFLIETPCAETLLPRFNPNGWGELGEILILESRKWDHRTSRIECDWTFIRGDEQHRQHSSVRLYSYRELESLLREVGFASFESFDATSGEPFGLGAARLAIVASKA